ncbi:MAG: hypothetical protein UY72_C0002G0002 [Candidatus Uhrbacteria bacterium GW2011_GWD2_52_7]|uniref:DUF1003 domain-containing protein n=1 Tax=Candidatus Uhrbacteria bacterium GW2011_GWD2_52_7 TaxID=1618989 RepID=A0A0G1ZRE6_9BACT|nr:MAG: hypothetical protein UY72_C0002G0002 [Candidatus Uhrbacteria bacterium GW2011_GWD2_52_7]
MSRRRSPSERIADLLTDGFGTISFFMVNVVLFAAWIIVNAGLVRGIAPFDPYPFNFLTMVVSLEAIFLSVIVLISQNRAAKNADLREEIDFQVNVQSEREITKILNMLEAIEAHMKIAKQHDLELLEMKEHLNLDELERRIRKTMAP